MRESFGEWLPDLPALTNPGALEAKNCVPRLTSYGSLRGLRPFTPALDSACLGAFGAVRAGATDEVFIFAGTASALWRLVGNAWVDVSQSSTAYGAARWEFARFGANIIACYDAGAPQLFNMATATNTTDFTNLPGAPQARHVGIVRDFVVLGQVADAPARVQWSGFNNSTQWASSAITQAGQQDLPGQGGVVQRIVGGEVGVLFQERAITRMTYVGPPVIFRFDEIERNRGTPASGSVVWTGSRVYYYAADGFYALDLLGGESIPIGHNRVNDWFRETADEVALPSMTGAVDNVNTLVIWAFKTSASQSANDHLILYNWTADRWSHAVLTTQQLIETPAPDQYTLDTLDGPTTPTPQGEGVIMNPTGPLIGGIDRASIPVDDAAYAGGSVPMLLAFDAANQGSTLSGNSLDLCVQTKELGFDDRLTYIHSVRPLVEAAPDSRLSITALTRNRQQDNPETTLPVVSNDIGTCDVRTHARYTRYQLQGVGPITHAIGVEFEPQRRGRR